MFKKISMFLVAFVLVLLFANSVLAYEWWNISWGYRKPFNITTTSGSHTDKTVYAYFIIPDAHIESDYDDLRFLTNCSLNAELIQHYFLSGTYDNYNPSKLRVGVVLKTDLDLINACVYYGNPSATSVSNITGMFDFNDSFSGASLNATNWDVVTGTEGVNFVVDNDSLIINGSGGASNTVYLKSARNFSIGHEIFIISELTEDTDYSNGYQANLIRYGFGNRMWESPYNTVNFISGTPYGSSNFVTDNGTSSEEHLSYNNIDLGGGYALYTNETNTIWINWINSSYSNSILRNGEYYIQISEFNSDYPLQIPTIDLNASLWVSKAAVNLETTEIKEVMIWNGTGEDITRTVGAEVGVNTTPQWSGLSVNDSTPTRGQDIRFSASWTDLIEFSNFIVEHNSSGSMSNESLESASGLSYTTTFDITTNSTTSLGDQLAVRFWMNNTFGIWNVTDFIYATLTNTAPVINEVTTNPSDYFWNFVSSGIFNLTVNVTDYVDTDDYISETNFTIWYPNGTVALNNVNGTQSGDIWTSSNITIFDLGYYNASVLTKDGNGGSDSYYNSTLFYVNDSTQPTISTILLNESCYEVGELITLTWSQSDNYDVDFAECIWTDTADSNFTRSSSSNSTGAANCSFTSSSIGVHSFWILVNDTEDNQRVATASTEIKPLDGCEVPVVPSGGGGGSEPVVKFVTGNWTVLRPDFIIWATIGSSTTQVITIDNEANDELQNIKLGCLPSTCVQSNPCSCIDICKYIYFKNEKYFINPGEVGEISFVVNFTEEYLEENDLPALKACDYTASLTITVDELLKPVSLTVWLIDGGELVNIGLAWIQGSTLGLPNWLILVVSSIIVIIIIAKIVDMYKKRKRGVIKLRRR